MDISLGVLALKDSFGTVVAIVAQSPESYITLGGKTSVSSCLKGTNGEPVFFAGRAGGVLEWAQKHGLRYETHDVTLDTDTRQVKSWKLV